ncbi:hypothetical protein [Candidatus Brocadia sapporoensis]|uniref:hypothetical protein n=1 Tax=Candidatus Brocadia sapporoensis TaxID=392547 RepID=UPI001E3D89AA|nr:hypothetical protein [Candidatus Brocadia sapporoensis]
MYKTHTDATWIMTTRIKSFRPKYLQEILYMPKQTNGSSLIKMKKGNALKNITQYLSGNENSKRMKKER